MSVVSDCLCQYFASSAVWPGSSCRYGGRHDGFIIAEWSDGFQRHVAAAEIAIGYCHGGFLYSFA
jgi:hypothetical protein